MHAPGREVGDVVGRYAGEVGPVPLAPFLEEMWVALGWSRRGLVCWPAAWHGQAKMKL